MTAGEWEERYVGTCILASPFDHRPIGPERYTKRILTGPRPPSLPKPPDSGISPLAPKHELPLYPHNPDKYGVPF